MTSAEELEELVVRFLDLCEERPGLAPEDFARKHASAGDELLAAIRRTLVV